MIRINKNINSSTYSELIKVREDYLTNIYPFIKKHNKSIVSIENIDKLKNEVDLFINRNNLKKLKGYNIVYNRKNKLYSIITKTNLCIDTFFALTYSVYK